MMNCRERAQKIAKTILIDNVQLSTYIDVRIYRS